MTSGPSKGVHPFFKGLRSLDGTDDSHGSEAAIHQPEQPPAEQPNEPSDSATGTQHENHAHSTRDSRADSPVRPLQQQQANLSNSGSNKRQKLDVATSPSDVTSDIGPAATPTRSTRSLKAHASDAENRKDSPNSSPTLAQTESKQPELKLNGRGGFSTPKKQKPGPKVSGKLGQESGSKTSRGRPKRGSLVAILRYDHLDDDSRRAFGQRIDKILTDIPKPQSTGEAPSAPLHTRPVNPSKPTHPFFSGKVERSKAPAQETSPTHGSPAQEPAKVKSFTTPVKVPRVPTPASSSKESIPAFSLTSASHSKPAVSGTRYPLWPPWGFNHHRDYAHDVPCQLMFNSKQRSQKERPITIPKEQDVLVTLAKCLGVAAGLDRHQAGRRLTLPQRQLETQSTMRQKVQSELVRLGSCHPDDKSVARGNDYQNILQSHAALKALYAKIGDGLTAFDRASCDSQAWCVKYAPQKASHVLQPERETSILREWLRGLTIDAVEKRLHEQTRSRDSSRDRVEKVRRKKRKKAKSSEFDDFLVDSDEEGELATLQAEDELPTSVDHDEPRTMVREALSRSTAGKTSNAMLISGPHGCGKTAAVFAVARELGFEVFEINSASRRSGKDILDKVGDMALNHQVRQHSSTTATVNDDPLPEAFPSQATKLNSFFKPASTAKPKNAKNRKDEKPAKAAKKQTQALILLEEVDVLFDDDRQFWDTVMTLAIQSRRPIIMTCEDEALLPLEDLPLHAILRFRTPSTALASSYLLGVAAAEGHLIPHDALSRLYQAKRRDLRASIMELQFRCQMAIGDDKGGLNWWLSRWPPRSDVDEGGEVLHVVSSGTFEQGTDLSVPRLECGIAEVERLSSEGWFEYEVEPLTLAHESLDALDMQTRHTSDAAQSLTEVERFLDYLSDADALGSVDLPTTPGDDSANAIDPSLPGLTDKDYHDHTIGHQLLQGDTTRDYSQLGAAIRVSTSIQARRLLQAPIQASQQQRTANQTLHDTVQTALVSAVESARHPPPARPRETARKTHAALAPLLSDDRALPAPALPLDIAPYVRTIVAYDLALAHQRRALRGGDGAALRRTRASRSALEGGLRSATRRDRWFGGAADYARVLETAGAGWPRCEGAVLAARGRAVLGGAGEDGRDDGEAA